MSKLVVCSDILQIREVKIFCYISIKINYLPGYTAVCDRWKRENSAREILEVGIQLLTLQQRQVLEYSYTHSTVFEYQPWCRQKLRVS
jgi:hypothetical protein